MQEILNLMDMITGIPIVGPIIIKALMAAVGIGAVWFLPFFAIAKTGYGVALSLRSVAWGLRPLVKMTKTLRDDNALARLIQGIEFAIRWFEFCNRFLASISKLKFETAGEVWGDFFNPPAPSKSKRK